MTNAAVTAASTAFPPFFRTSRAALEARSLARHTRMPAAIEVEAGAAGQRRQNQEELLAELQENSLLQQEIATALSSLNENPAPAVFDALESALTQHGETPAADNGDQTQTEPQT